MLFGIERLVKDGNGNFVFEACLSGEFGDRLKAFKTREEAEKEIKQMYSDPSRARVFQIK